MLKKIGFPALALLGMLAFAPHQAEAAVRVGVVIGRPVCPPVVVAPAPVYGPAYVNGVWVGRDFHREVRRDVRFHRELEHRR